MKKDSRPSFLHTRLIPVGTIIIAIIIAWYIAAYRMNAPFQRDQNERSNVTVTQSEFVAQTMSQPKPTMPAPHQVAATLWKNTFGVKLTSNRSLVYAADAIGKINMGQEISETITASFSDIKPSYFGSLLLTENIVHDYILLAMTQGEPVDI